jgi:hypothetical protein
MDAFEVLYDIYILSYTEIFGHVLVLCLEAAGELL